MERMLSEPWKIRYTNSPSPLELNAQHTVVQFEPPLIFDELGAFSQARLDAKPNSEQRFNAFFHEVHYNHGLGRNFAKPVRCSGIKDLWESGPRNLMHACSA